MLCGLLYLGQCCWVNPRGSAGVDVAGADHYATQPHCWLLAWLALVTSPIPCSTHPISYAHCICHLLSHYVAPLSHLGEQSWLFCAEHLLCSAPCNGGWSQPSVCSMVAGPMIPQPISTIQPGVPSLTSIFSLCMPVHSHHHLHLSTSPLSHCVPQHCPHYPVSFLFQILLKGNLDITTRYL